MSATVPGFGGHGKLWLAKSRWKSSKTPLEHRAGGEIECASPRLVPAQICVLLMIPLHTTMNSSIIITLVYSEWQCFYFYYLISNEHSQVQYKTTDLITQSQLFLFCKAHFPVHTTQGISAKFISLSITTMKACSCGKCSFLQVKKVLWQGCSLPNITCMIRH